MLLKRTFQTRQVDNRQTSQIDRERKTFWVEQVSKVFYNRFWLNKTGRYKLTERERERKKTFWIERTSLERKDSFLWIYSKSEKIKSRQELYILNRLSYKLDFYSFENGTIAATFYVKINFLSDHYLNSGFYDSAWWEILTNQNWPGVLGVYDRDHWEIWTNQNWPGVLGVCDRDLWEIWTNQSWPHSKVSFMIFPPLLKMEKLNSQ
jgi:hypothetical protein